MSTPTLMPTLFIPHGAGPCFFMDWNPPDTWDRMREFLLGIAETLPARPSAIVMVSAHWIASGFDVTSGSQPELIYDYGGFPPHTYELTYPASGSPELAERLQVLLTEAGLSSHADPQRGFDHGMFIPLKLMFPEADIPVVQLSLQHGLSPQAHLDAGRAIASLRHEGVLIVGSGMSFHNMRGYGDSRFGPISDQFDAWLKLTVEAAPTTREENLAQWALAPVARLCHPPHAEEHLLPLMVAAGAAPEGRGQRIFVDRALEATLSAFRFD